MTDLDAPMVCDGCQANWLTTDPNTLQFMCEDCGERGFREVYRYNTTPYVVWVRSPRLVYTTELLPRNRCEGGVIEGRPDLKDFVWEPWP